MLLKRFWFCFNDNTYKHQPQNHLARTNRWSVPLRQVERSLVAAPLDKNTWLDAFTCCRKRVNRELPARDYDKNTFYLFLCWPQNIEKIFCSDESQRQTWIVSFNLCYMAFTLRLDYEYICSDYILTNDMLLICTEIVKIQT